MLNFVGELYHQGTNGLLFPRMSWCRTLCSGIMWTCKGTVLWNWIGPCVCWRIALIKDMCRVDIQIFSWHLHFLIHIIVLAARLQNTGGFVRDWPPACAKFASVFLIFASVWLCHPEYQLIFQIKYPRAVSWIVRTMRRGCGLANAKKYNYDVKTPSTRLLSACLLSFNRVASSM